MTSLDIPHVETLVELFFNALLDSRKLTWGEAKAEARELASRGLRAVEQDRADRRMISHAAVLADRLRRLVNSPDTAVRINLVVNLLNGEKCLSIEEQGPLSKRWRKVQPLIFGPAGSKTHADALRFVADALDGNPEVPR